MSSNNISDDHHHWDQIIIIMVIYCFIWRKGRGGEGGGGKYRTRMRNVFFPTHLWLNRIGKYHHSKNHAYHTHHIYTYIYHILSHYHYHSTINIYTSILINLFKRTNSWVAISSCGWWLFLLWINILPFTIPSYSFTITSSSSISRLLLVLV